MGVFFAGRWGPRRVPVVLKLNANEQELAWMPAVAARAADLVPAVYAAGATLGDVDVGWLVLADTPHRFDSARAEDCRGLMAAAARFQQVAADIDGPTYAIDRGFFDLYLPMAVNAGCPGPGVEVLDRMPSDLAWLDQTGPQIRCHGDVHFANAVSTEPGGRLLLVDPIPRTAHWAWDAAYAEGTSGVPGTPPLVPLLAEARQHLGLAAAAGGTLTHIEAILLGWSSMLWWAIVPYRRTDPWWAEKVRTHVHRLADLPQ